MLPPKPSPLNLYTLLHTYLHRLLCFATLVLLQALVFGHIHIAGCAIPMPYVYFLLLLPSDTSRSQYLLWGFTLGFAVDMCSITPGMASASMTLTALLTPYLVRIFSPSDKGDEAYLPSAKTMQWGPFLRCAFCLVLCHTFTFYLIEAFSLHNAWLLLVNTVGTTALTLLLIAAAERVRTR